LNPTRTQDFLRLHLGSRDHEVFGLLHLDNQHRVIAVEDLFRGTRRMLVSELLALITRNPLPTTFDRRWKCSAHVSANTHTEHPAPADLRRLNIPHNTGERIRPSGARHAPNDGFTECPGAAGSHNAVLGARRLLT
jgi:hypothetical protein